MSEIDLIEADMKLLFPEVVDDYAKIMGLSGEVIKAFTELECEYGDANYYPYPTIIENGGRDLKLVCNVNGMRDGWDNIFNHDIGIDEEMSRRIYIAAGLASVGLVHIAYDAIESRGEKVKAGLHKVKRITEQLDDKEVIESKITELEEAEKIETSLYPIEVSSDDVQLINRIRFNLGVAYLVTDLDFDTREKAGDVFLENFSEDLRKMGESLISFARGFGLDKQVDMEVFKQKGVSRALHVFNFAGIFPMDMSDIMRT